MKQLISMISFILSLQFYSVCSYAQLTENVIYQKSGLIKDIIRSEQITGNFTMVRNDSTIKSKLKSDTVKTKLSSDTINNPIKESIAKNSITFQPIGLVLLLTNIEYDRAISNNFSTGIKTTFTAFLLRKGITFSGNQSDVDKAETIKNSISSFGIGSHIRYYPGNKAIEGFFLGIAVEGLSGKYDELKKTQGTDSLSTIIHNEASLWRMEFEIGSRSKISGSQGGFTIQWSLGAGIGFWKKEKDKGVVPLGSIGFGIGYSF